MRNFRKMTPTMAPEWLSEKNFRFFQYEPIIYSLKHVIWRFQICNYFREMFKFCNFMNTLGNFAKSVFARILISEIQIFRETIESPDHVL